MPNHSPLLHPPSDEQNKTIQQTNQPDDQWTGLLLALEVLQLDIQHEGRHLPMVFEGYATIAFRKGKLSLNSATIMPYTSRV